MPAAGISSEELVMPLRDHFKPPVSKAGSWEGVHGQWPAMMVLSLNSKLPPGYVAAPRVHHGAFVEVDVATYERAEAPAKETWSGDADAGTSPSLWSPARPSLAVEAEPPETDE